MKRKFQAISVLIAIFISMTLASCAPCNLSSFLSGLKKKIPPRKAEKEIKKKVKEKLKPHKKGMVFVWEKEGDSVDIYLRTPNGNFVRLTKDGNQELFPKWHPKENKIAYISRSGGEDKLIILDLDKSYETKEIASASQISKLNWCDKGKSIMYSTYKDNLSSLYVVDVSGGGEPVAIVKDANNLSWTSDGKKTLYYSKLASGGEDMQIFKVENIWSPTSEEVESGFNPVLSSSGMKLLFQYPPMSDDYTTYLLEIPSGNKIDLFPDEPSRRYFHDFLLSLNEKNAVYVYSPYSYYDEKGLPYFFKEIEESEDTSKMGLYLIDFSSQTSKLLYSSPFMLDPLFAPTKKAVIFTSKVSDANSDTTIYSFNLLTEEKTKLAGAGNAYHPDMR